MNGITADPRLVAYCGLYCEACRAYRRGRCPGCRDTGAKWCQVRTCCAARGCETCAGCPAFDDPAECRTFNSPVARLFGMVTNSDRRACLLRVQRLGTAGFAAEMARRGMQSLPRRGPRTRRRATAAPMRDR